MKPLPAIILSGLLPVMALLCTESCGEKKACPYSLQTAGAHIVSVTGPASAAAGQQVAITVGVRNQAAYCVEEAVAGYGPINGDTLYINAGLRIAATDKGCTNCRQDSVLYTLLYFTPAGKGSYHIIAPADSTVTSESSALQYSITVY